MSIDLLKAELANLASDERRRLVAWLVALGDEQKPAYREELARKIDDKNPDNWLTLDDMEQRLGPLSDVRA